jgi:hypothetical protein
LWCGQWQYLVVLGVHIPLRALVLVGQQPGDVIDARLHCEHGFYFAHLFFAAVDPAFVQ